MSLRVDFTIFTVCYYDLDRLPSPPIPLPSTCSSNSDNCNALSTLRLLSLLFYFPHLNRPLPILRLFLFHLIMISPLIVFPIPISPPPSYPPLRIPPPIPFHSPSWPLYQSSHQFLLYLPPAIDLKHFNIKVKSTQKKTNSKVSRYNWYSNT